MTTPTPDIQRLVLWNRIFMSLLGATLACMALTFGFGQVVQHAQKLSVVWAQDGSIGFDTWSDGPFVITHLVRVLPTESGKAIAQLPKPIAIIDSEGAKMGKIDVDKLIWIDIQGQRVQSPQPRSRIRALYYRPLQTEMSQ